jgi:hypothetical protein
MTGPHGLQVTERAALEKKGKNTDSEEDVQRLLAGTLPAQYRETRSPNEKQQELLFLRLARLFLTILGPAALLRVCDALSGFRAEFALSRWLCGLVGGRGPGLLSAERRPNLSNLFFDSLSLHLKSFEGSGKERRIL